MSLISRRGPAYVVLCAALLVAVVACSVRVDGSASRGSAGGVPATSAGGSTGTGITQPSPTTGTGAGAPIPAGLESFYGQHLSWGPCQSFAIDDSTKEQYSSSTFQCAFLTVPLDYAAPAGPTVQLGVLKVPATGADRIGSLVINPGGPGVSGMSSAASLTGSAQALLQRFDLVGFDPRGVGASQPAIRCQTDAERDAERAKTDRTRTPAEVAAANTRTENRAKRCAELSGGNGVDGAKFLGTIGTVTVAKDLDVLRAVLGDDKLTYLGFSYGTSIGTVYAEQFAANVRAMILDGAVDPDADPVQEIINQGAGFQKAFDEFAAWCARQAGCVLGTDPAKATQVFQSLTRPLLDRPAAVQDGRVLSYDDAITGTIQSLYAEDFWVYLKEGLSQLSHGDGTVLMALADSYVQRDQSGHYANVIDALTGVNCMDNPRIDEATSQQMAEQYVKAAPFLDNGDPVVGLKSVCDFWPAEPTPPPRVSTIPGVPPVLVISTTQDPATPYQAGVNLAKAIGGRLLTVEGTRHTAYLGAGIPCVDEIGNAYLIDLTLPPDGKTCS